MKTFELFLAILNMFEDVLSSCRIVYESDNPVATLVGEFFDIKISAWHFRGRSDDGWIRARIQYKENLIPIAIWSLEDVNKLYFEFLRLRHDMLCDDGIIDYSDLSFVDEDQT